MKAWILLASEEYSRSVEDTSQELPGAQEATELCLFRWSPLLKRHI